MSDVRGVSERSSAISEADRDRLHLVYAILRAFTRAEHETALLENAAALLSEHRSYRLVLIVACEPDGSVRVLARGGELARASEPFDPHIRWDDSPQGQGTIGRAVRGGGAEISDAATINNPDWRATALASGVVKAAAFPFRIGEARGALYAVSAEIEGFAHAEIELLQGLADDIGRAVENLRLQKALRNERAQAQSRLERLEALWSLANTDRDLDAQALEIVSDGASRLGLEWGAIGHAEGNEVIVDFVTAGDPVGLAGKRFGIDDSITGLALRHGRTATHIDILDDPALLHLTTARQYGTRSVISTPFAVGDERYVLFFGAREARSEPFNDEDVAYVELLAAFFGRARQRRFDEARIAFLQQHDPLTLLPNRARLLARLHELIGRHERSAAQLALLLIDIDAFRDVNAIHGFDTGDQMLIEVTNRLVLALETTNELYRLSGDTFGVLVPSLIDATQADALARKIIDLLAGPMLHRGREISMSVSIGMALYPDDATTPAELEIDAEAALRRAAREGRSGRRFYSSDLDEALGRRRVLEAELRIAVSARELELYFQPIIDLRTRALLGVEALVRWPHAKRGLLEPAEFIAIAEESDIILPLGALVIELAATQAAALRAAGRALPVAINLSALQLQDPQLLPTLRRAIDVVGGRPDLIEIELTETVAMHDYETARSVLAACEELGLRIALDDFGTGHSSLTLLRRLPFDIVKIDRSFVNGLPDDVEDAAIARAVVALARSLGCEVRAEGVETETQAVWLADEGAHSAQGFLFARPMPAGILEEWMKGHP